jgi:hypothetical protein
MYSEQELVTALRRRDPDAFAYLFESYSDKVYRLAAGLLNDMRKPICVELWC